MAAKKPVVLLSPKLRQISSKFQLLHRLFRVDASTGGTADVARSSKFQLLHPLFRVDAFTGGTTDVARRRCLSEI